MWTLTPGGALASPPPPLPAGLLKSHCGDRGTSPPPLCSRERGCDDGGQSWTRQDSVHVAAPHWSLRVTNLLSSSCPLSVFGFTSARVGSSLQDTPYYPLRYSIGLASSRAIYRKSYTCTLVFRGSLGGSRTGAGRTRADTKREFPECGTGANSCVAISTPLRSHLPRPPQAAATGRRVICWRCSGLHRLMERRTGDEFF
jgi:hypothetical protein